MGAELLCASWQEWAGVGRRGRIAVPELERMGPSWSWGPNCCARVGKNGAKLVLGAELLGLSWQKSDGVGSMANL